MSDSGHGEEHFRARVLSELAACGVASDRVTIQYEDYLQDFDIVIHGAAATPDADQFACIARLQATGLIISFDDIEANAKFLLAVQSAFRSKARDDALVWLAERDLLDNLPLFDPSATDLASYAASLERHCGVLPGSILEVYDKHLLTIRRDLDVSALLGGDEWRRISHAVAASNLADHDITLGFLGSTSESA
jgi:hypothetical protein